MLLLLLHQLLLLHLLCSGSCGGGAAAAAVAAGNAAAAAKAVGTTTAIATAVATAVATGVATAARAGGAGAAHSVSREVTKREPENPSDLFSLLRSKGEVLPNTRDNKELQELGIYSPRNTEIVLKEGAHVQTDFLTNFPTGTGDVRFPLIHFTSWELPTSATPTLQQRDQRLTGFRVTRDREHRH